MKVDRKAPVVSCAAPDSAWHATDVALPCTSTEGGSGFVSAADASFNLTTSVPAGTETDTAATGSRAVCDLVANCSTVGPVGGIKVDKKAPVSVISSPAATAYLHNSTLTLGYTVTDGGSGVATTGPTLDGAGDRRRTRTRERPGDQPADGGDVRLPCVRGAHGGRGRKHLRRLGVVPGDRHAGCRCATRWASSARTATSPSRGSRSSLLAKLAAGAEQSRRGDCATAANQYAAFVNEVQAQAGKAIDNAVASILIADAQYLIAHCP